MCNKIRKLWACACEVLNSDGTRKWILERCESNCGNAKDTKYAFGPILCASHEVPFIHSLGNGPASKEATDKLTVGIEFEFFVAHEGTVMQQDDVAPERWMVTKAHKTQRPSELAKRHIVTLLEGTVPIYASHALGRSLTWLKNRMAKFDMTKSLTQFPEFAMWLITTDVSLKPVQDEDPAGYGFTQTKMELVSRVLSEENLAEVEIVYRKMRESLRVHVNKTCGLHVHVGVSHLSFLEIKKLITALMSFETFLFHLVAPHRRDNPFCSPLTTSSTAYADNEETAYDYQGDEDMEPLGRIDHNDEMHAWLPPSGLSIQTISTFRHIWNATTFGHIRNELSVYASASDGGLRNSCALLRGEQTGVDMDGNRRSSDITFEFRHREATGDPAVDRRWVELCVALVRCAQLPNYEFIELIRTTGNANVQFGSQPSPGVFASLLGALGLGTSVNFWLDVYQQYQRRLTNPPAPALLPPLPSDMVQV